MLTALAGLVGVGLQAFGTYQSYQAQQQQQSAAQQQAQIQSQINSFQQQNVALQQQASALRFQDTFTQMEYNKQVIAQQQRIEGTRKQAMLLDASRKRNEAVRELILAQSMSRANAVSKGVSGGDTSLYGAGAQLASRAYQNVLQTNQAQYASLDIFRLNKNITDIQTQAQTSNQGFLRQIVDLEQQSKTQQANVYALGGQASAVSQQSASAQSQAALGSSLYSIGGTISSPQFQQTGSNVYNTLFPQQQSTYNQGYNTTGGIFG